MKHYATYEDSKLLELIREDDQIAYTEIFNRYWQPLYFSARKKMADQEQSKDIVLEVLLSIWERRKELDIQFLAAYLEKAVRFKVINFVNRNKIPHFFDLLEKVIHSPYEADLPLRNKDLEKLVRYLIDALPPTRREIFEKHYYDSKCVEEIAGDLGLSVKTVRNNLSMIYQYFRAQLSKLTVLLILFCEHYK